jgi:hypothetical protein
MPFQIKITTDEERKLLLIDEDSYVITSDTKKMYAGDGKTLGGILVTNSNSIIEGSLDLLSYDNEIIAKNIRIEDPLGGIEILTEGTLDDDYSLFNIKSFQNTADSSGATFVRSRGRINNPLVIRPGDKIFTLNAAGRALNNSVGISSVIEFSVDPAYEVKEHVVAGKVSIYNADSLGVLKEVLTLNSNGVLGLSNNILTAGSEKGEVNNTSPVSFLKIQVDGKDYAIPLYGIND